MSVQKIHKNTNLLKQAKKPFELIYRHILNNLKDGNALAVYAHLTGKPDDWEINDQYLMNHFGWGRDKVRNAMKTLIVNKLIRRIQLVNEKGQFEGRITELLDGYEFTEFIEFDSKIHGKLCEFQQIPLDEGEPLTEKPYDGLSVDGKQAATEEDIKALTKECDHKERIGSPSLSEPFPADFFPTSETLDLLNLHALRTNNPTHVLLDKFEQVSKKYKTRSLDWQKSFADFLARELPKRTYEDATGKKRRYDDQQIHN